METVAVTGASGFIGTAVVEHLLAAGCHVRALVRTPASWRVHEHPAVTCVVGDIRDPAAVADAVRSADWVCHLAAAKSDERDSEAINVAGAQAVVDACLRHGVRRVVNISTQSAKLRNRGLYGRTKEAADRVFAGSGLDVTTLRPSLVYADATSGILGSLASATRLPAVPMIGASRAVFRPIHRDDLARAIAAVAKAPATIGQTYDVGGPDAISLRGLVDALMMVRGVWRPRVHLPEWCAMAIARVLTVLPRPPLTVSNVRGANEIVPMDVQPFFAAAGFVPRGLAEGLLNAFGIAGEREAAAAAEGAALIRYVAGLSAAQAIAPELPQRYAAALQARGIDPIHRVIPMVQRSRLLLGCLDAGGRLFFPRNTLQQKLLVASAIWECHPASAEALLPRDHSTLRLCAATLACVGGAGAKMAGAVVLRLVPGFVRFHVRPV